MPAHESEMIQAIADGIADQQAMPDEKGIEDVLAIVEKLRAAAHTKGMEEASMAIQGLIQARNEEELNDYQNGFMDALDCAWHAIRSRIKDQ